MLALIDAGVSLTQMLGAADAVYGTTFNGALSLKALAFFADGDLPTLSASIQSRLRTLASQVDLQHIVSMQARIGVIGGV